MVSLNIFQNNSRHFGDYFMYDRYLVTFLINLQFIFLLVKDKKWNRHLTLFTLKLLHRVTSRFTAAVLTAHPSIITHWHPYLSNTNIFMNASSENSFPSPSSDSSYMLQPAMNSATLHLSYQWYKFLWIWHWNCMVKQGL